MTVIGHSIPGLYAEFAVLTVAFGVDQFFFFFAIFAMIVREIKKALFSVSTPNKTF